ncbi:MAG: tetratricopeptide repeat protein [Bryobacterales bacterium]|nr:tetratricopeptide repeat protein [Bryobacterales bacterium]
MIESLLLFGLAAFAGKRLQSTTLDGIAANQADIALRQTWSNFRQNLTAHQPIRNEPVRTALRRAYLQSVVQAVVIWADRHSVPVRPRLRTFGLPDWMVETLDAVAPDPPQTLKAHAEAPALDAVLRRMSERLRSFETEMIHVSVPELEATYQALDSLMGSTTGANGIVEELTNRVIEDIRPHWQHGMPQQFEEFLRAEWYPVFDDCFRQHCQKDPAAAAMLQTLLQVQVLDEVREMRGEMRQGFAAVLHRVEPSRATVRFPMRVNVPDLTAQIVGRDEEAALILEELTRSGGRRILPLIAPPAFGKSALLIRALQLAGEDIPRLVVLNCRGDGPRDAAWAFGQVGRLVAPMEESTNPEWMDLARAELSPREKAAAFWTRVDATGPVWLVWENLEEWLDTPESGNLVEPARRALFEEFAARDGPHRMVVLSQWLPRIPGLEPWEAISRALAEGLSVPEGIRLLRERGANCGFSEAPEDVLDRLHTRLLGMPAALAAAVEYVKECWPELDPGRLEREAAFFADFDRGDRERGFQAQVRALLGRMAPEMRRLTAYLAILPEPIPRDAIAALLEEPDLTRVLARLQTSVILAHLETDVFGDRWYRLHGVARKVAWETSTDLPDGQLAEIANRCLEEGGAARRAKRFARSAALCQSAETLFQRLDSTSASEHRVGLAVAQMNLGVALSDLKRYDEAVSAYETAVATRKELVESGHTDLREGLGTARMNLGNVLSCLKRYGQAIQMYQAAIETFRSLGLPERQAIARMNLGNALAGLKLYDAAVVEYMAAVNEYQHVPPESLPDLAERLATLHTNLGSVLGAAGLHSDAAEAHRLAVGIRANLADEGRTDILEDVAAAQMNLAVELCELRDYQEALELCRAAVATYETLVTHGRTDLRDDLARAELNLATTLLDLRQYRHALPGFERAIMILKDVISEGRVDLREDLYTAQMNQGIAYRLVGNSDEAVVVLESALVSLEDLRQAGNPPLADSIAKVQVNLGNALLDLKRYEEAEEAYTSAIGIREALVKAGRSDLREHVATAWLNLGAAQYALKRHDESLQSYKVAAELWNDLIRTGRSDLRHNLALCLENKYIIVESMGRLDAALELITSVVSLRRTLVKDGFSQVEPALQRSIELQSSTLAAIAANRSLSDPDPPG